MHAILEHFAYRPAAAAIHFSTISFRSSAENFKPSPVDPFTATNNNMKVVQVMLIQCHEYIGNKDAQSQGKLSRQRTGTDLTVKISVAKLQTYVALSSSGWNCTNTSRVPDTIN